jgi:hypothetical protein
MRQSVVGRGAVLGGLTSLPVLALLYLISRLSTILPRYSIQRIWGRLPLPHIPLRKSYSSKHRPVRLDICYHEWYICATDCQQSIMAVGVVLWI